jgi:endonuclease-8
MPEGPECKIISEQLNGYLCGKKILDISVLTGRYSDSTPIVGLDSFLKDGPLKVRSVSCKGKFIYVLLNGSDSRLKGWSMWNTLGTAGWWTPLESKHSRVRFSLDQASSLYFNDTNNFGTIKLEGCISKLRDKLRSIGPDMLSSPASSSDFYSLINSQNQNKNICKFLLNQKLISGVGNYIKSESLYMSRISPHRKCGSISLFEAVSLRMAIVKVIKDSYTSGGIFKGSDRTISPVIGSYSNNLCVYSKQKDPFGRDVMVEKTDDNRNTYWVPSIQR